MIKSEAKNKYPDLADLLRDYKNTIEGAESFEDFQIRIIRAIKGILKMNNETIAIVTHGGPIITILRQIESASDYKIKDCAFAEIDIVDGIMKVISLNGIIGVK